MKQTFELFPSLLEIYFYPDWVNLAIEVSNKILEKEKILDTVTHGCTMHGEKELRPLVDIVGRHSKEFLINQGYSFDNHVLIFESFWPQIFNSNGGGYHDVHVHRNTHVSGFYFLKCGLNSSYPIFHDPRPGKSMTQLPEKNEEKITPASYRAHFNPTPGALFIFNSFLPHSFAYDLGKETFQFIHFTMAALPKHYIARNEV